MDGATLGLTGAKQIFRIDQRVEYLRRGRVYKTSQESRYGVSSLTVKQADPNRVLELVRGYWAIEIKQHYRRDHTQREDHCQVRERKTAHNLSLMRSLAIFLYEQQRSSRHGKAFLPDWLRKNMRNPFPLIRLMTRAAA